MAMQFYCLCFLSFYIIPQYLLPPSYLLLPHLKVLSSEMDPAERSLLKEEAQWFYRKIQPVPNCVPLKITRHRIQ